MKCSRCGSRYPNQSCYVCRDEPPARETPDPEGGSLLKTMTMKPETARTCSAFALVASVITLILLAAAGCKDFEAYVAVVMLAIMAAFVGSTADA